MCSMKTIIRLFAMLLPLALTQCQNVNTMTKNPDFDFSGEYTTLSEVEQKRQYDVSDDEYDGVRISPYVGDEKADLESIKGYANEFKGIATVDIESATKDMHLSKWMVEIMSYQRSNTYERFAMLKYPLEFYDQAPEMAALHRNGEYTCLHNFLMEICPQVVKTDNGFKVNPQIIEMRGFMTYHNYERHPLGSRAVEKAYKRWNGLDELKNDCIESTYQKAPSVGRLATSHNV